MTAAPLLLRLAPLPTRKARRGPTLSVSADASAGPDGGGISADAFMNGIELELSIDAFSSSRVDVPEPGLYTLSFALWGRLVNTGVSVSVIGEGLNGQWSAYGSHFWQSGPNETFTTAPVMLEEGPTCIRPICAQD